MTSRGTKRRYRCVCDRKWIARGKYCDHCRRDARLNQSREYYARRGRRLKIVKPRSLKS